MTSGSYVAIDLGASSGRVMLGRLENGLLALHEVHRFANEPVSYGGGLHWNIASLWQQIRRGLEAVGPLAGETVTSIGVDCWGVDYALLGEGGRLLHNPYHYRDKRTEGVMEQVCSLAGKDWIYQRTGIQFMPINTLYQLYAAWKATPRLLEAADHLVTIPDLLNYWLTGIVACEYTNASTTQFLAADTKTWADDLLRKLGIPTHLLTNVVAPGTVLGPLRPELAGGEGLSQTVVVAPACHDTGSAVASIQASGETAFLSSGTWSLLGTEVARPVISPAASQLNFTNEGGVNGTIRLLKNITGLWLLECCRREWGARDAELSWTSVLDSMAGAAPFRSLVDPDHAGFVNPPSMIRAIDLFCERTEQPGPRTTGEYVRTILGSLALKYRYVLEELETVSGLRFTRLRVIGGGAKNDVLNQFTADATGRAVVAGPAEATALGNIAMQMVASGGVASLEKARESIEVSQVPRSFAPMQFSSWDRVFARFVGLVENASRRFESSDTAEHATRLQS